MPGLASYMAQYDHEHSSAWNKVLHGVGIPMIFAGIVLLILTKWIWGALFFVGGWLFLFLGHRIEGNHPAFFQGPRVSTKRARSLRVVRRSAMRHARFFAVPFLAFGLYAAAQDLPPAEEQAKAAQRTR